MLGLYSLMDTDLDAMLFNSNPRRTLITGRNAGVVTPDFDPIEPGETDVFTFDITREVEDSETVAAVTWDCMLAQTMTGFTPDTAPGLCITTGARRSDGPEQPHQVTGQRAG